MIDFTITEISRSAIIFCATFYFSIVGRFWNTASNKDLKIRNQGKWLFLLVLIFSVVSWTNGDWYHYQWRMQLTDLNNTIITQEEFYNHLTLFINRNYLIFRTIVWGTALTLVYQSFVILRLDAYRTLYFMFIVFINYFDYSRSALGVAVYFFGLSIMASCHGWKKIPGLAILCCAYYFHRSTIVLSGLTILYFIPINKKTISLILITVVVLYGVIQKTIIGTLTEISSEEGDMALKVAFYMSQEAGELISGSIIGILIGVWKYAVFYILFAYSTYYLYKNSNYKSLPTSIRGIYNILFGLILLAVLVYTMNIGHLAFYYRYLMMSYLPLSILIVYLYTHNMMPKRIYKSLSIFSGGYVAFEFIYRSIVGA